MAHMLNHPFFCSDLVVSTRLSSTGGEEEELNDESVYSLLQRCHGDHGGAVPDGKTHLLMGYDLGIYYCLVVWNMNFVTFHILGIIIPTDFHIFHRG